MSADVRFLDRAEAGSRLAERLQAFDLVHPVVLALPRGGVPVAAEVADALEAPLEVFVARKIGAPGHPERGIGAIAEGGDAVRDEVALRLLAMSPEEFDRLVGEEQRELDRRVRHFRGDRPLPDLRHRDVVVVDDGLATGVTAEAALQALRRHHPSRLVLAVPVCARPTQLRLSAAADDVVCVLSPEDFRAVGLWYENFDQTSDEEVLALLRAASERAARTPTREG